MMPLKDPEARRAYHREYMRKRLQTDPDFRRKHRKRVERNKRKYKEAGDQKVAAFYAKHGCIMPNCSEIEPCCLTAHHVDPSTKSFALGDRSHSYSPATIQKELRKCVCLCANCHTKLHAGLMQLPDNALETQHL